jgi:hypothetical protein
MDKLPAHLYVQAVKFVVTLCRRWGVASKLELRYGLADAMRPVYHMAFCGFCTPRYYSGHIGRASYVFEIDGQKAHVCDLCTGPFRLWAADMIEYYRAVYYLLRCWAAQTRLPWAIMKHEVWLKHLAPRCETTIRGMRSAVERTLGCAGQPGLGSRPPG